MTNPNLLVQGEVAAVTVGEFQACVESGPPRVCHIGGSPDCDTREYAEVNEILIDAPTDSTGCAEHTCSARQYRSGVDHYRTYSRLVALVPGVNTIQVSGQNSYYNGVRVPCMWQIPNPPMGSACRLGTGGSNSYKTITVTYSPPPCVLTTATCTKPSGYRVALGWSGTCGTNTLQRTTIPPGTPFSSLVSGVTSYNDSAVTANTTYRYKVVTGTGTDSVPVDVAVNDCTCAGICGPQDDAKSISDDLPVLVSPGQQFIFNIVMKNTGLATWIPAAAYQLTTSGANAARWNIAASQTVNASYSPQSNAIFTFAATAPITPGLYAMEPWRMYHVVAFGESSAQKMIRVNDRPAGTIEQAVCTAISGYAKNPETAAPISVEIYRDGDRASGTRVAGPFAANKPHAVPYDGYGWSWTPPEDTVGHGYTAWALDPDDNTWYQLGATPVLPCLPPPTVSELGTVPTDFCTAGSTGTPPAIQVNWKYTSTMGLPQKQWQLQVATDNDFSTGSNEYDSGVQPTVPIGTPTSPSPLSNTGIGGIPAGELTYGQTYWWRMEVWDTNGSAAPWSTGAQLMTPLHAYPIPGFTVEPDPPVANQVATFKDTSTYSTGVTLQNWQFSDGSTANGTIVTHTFPTEGASSVTLTVTDGDGYACSLPRSFNVKRAIPIWKEIIPGL